MSKSMFSKMFGILAPVSIGCVFVLAYYVEFLAQFLFAVIMSIIIFLPLYAVYSFFIAVGEFIWVKYYD